MAQQLIRAVRLRLAPISIVLMVVIGGAAIQVRDNLPAQDYTLVPGTDDVFPSFGVSRNIYVVQVPADTEYGMLLTLYSLQGLVNRQGARIYLDVAGADNMSFLLPFIEGRYGVDLNRVSIESFLSNFSSYASGLVVYNPSIQDTVNLATVIAGIDSFVIVDPAAVGRVGRLTGLSVQADLREPPWAGLSGVQLYRRSFDELHGFCYPKMLAILPPDKLGSRDYLIAAKTWTFHLTPGPFSPQENIDFTDEIMTATPHNIPVLGWFEMPTLVEENYFVQSASRHGKFLVGGEFVPNLSFLSSLPAPNQFMQKRIIPTPPALSDDGIYVNFAVPDGDNIDFIAGKMHDIWQEGVRGSVPLTWSVNPLLTELAPALLDYYYFNASAMDSFVAAPSGGGYLYPGFVSPADLEQYLVRAKIAMNAADLDTIWLLNSFRAYEIPYPEGTLETYATSLAPRGILLDYADQAVTRDVWMQQGQGTAAPVIRSTHLWSGMNNLIGKMMADIDAAPSSPHFFFVTVYPWTIDLGDAVRSLDILQRRYGDRVQTVSVESMLSLVAGAFVEEARAALSDISGQPFASIDFWDHDAAVAEMGEAVDSLARQETSLAGLHAYVSLERARRALAVGTIIFLTVVVVALLAIVLVVERRRGRNDPGPRGNVGEWLAPGVCAAALFYIFFAGLLRALAFDFWTYASVFTGAAVLVLAPRLQISLERAYGGNALPLEATVLAASGLVLLWEPWAFVPFACASAMLIWRFLGRLGLEKDAVFFGLGVGGAVLIPYSWVSLAFFIAIVAVVGHGTRPEAPTWPRGERKAGTAGTTFAATTLALMVVWTVLYQNRYFSERMGGGLDLLRALSVIALIAAPLLALFMWRAVRQSHRLDAIVTLSVTAGLWVVLWFSQGLILVSCIVMAMAVLVAWSHLSASARVRWTSESTARYTSGLLILGMIVVVLVRFPAIVYSLYVVPGLPVAVEYILYTPPLLMIFATIDIIQTEALFRAAKRRVEPKRAGPEDYE